jgi:hypothetical protein
MVRQRRLIRMITRMTTLICISPANNYFSAMYFGRGATWVKKGVGEGATSVKRVVRGTKKFIENPIKKGTRRIPIAPAKSINPSPQCVFFGTGTIKGGGGDRSSLAGQVRRNWQVLQGVRVTPSTLVNYGRINENRS